MRLSLALVVVLAAAGALAVATAGAPFEDDLNETDIILENSSGPNGVYAVEEDGELAIRITEGRQELAADGVNPDGVTDIETIFRIVNRENQTAEVWIETDVPDVEFRTGSESIEGEENNVTLEPGDHVTVGLRIDTTGDHDVEQIEEFTVVADPVEEASESGESDSDGTRASVGDDTTGGSDDTTSGSGSDDTTSEDGSNDESGDTTIEDGPDDEDSDDTTSEGGPGDESEDTTSDTGPGEEGSEQDDQSDPGDGPDGGDGDGGSDETGEDGPGTETDGGDEDPSTDGDDGTTGDGPGDTTTDLVQTGQPAVFEPAQTLGGFLPQLVGLLLAILAGAVLLAAVRKAVGDGES